MLELSSLGLRFGDRERRILGEKGFRWIENLCLVLFFLRLEFPSESESISMVRCWVRGGF